MTSIKLTVSGASARAEVDGLLTSGMVGIPVTIACDGAWDGLTKAVVCRAGSIVKTILNVGGTATVAHECMVPNQTLFIGIEGRNADGTLVIPTVWARCGLIFSGATTDADPSADPTLPVWAQIGEKVGNLDDLNTEDKSSLVAAIKSNKSLIDAITTSKVSVSDIVNDLVTNVADKPLSAAQGVALKALIDAITVPDKLPNPNALTFTGAVSATYDGSAPLEVTIPSGGGAAGDYIHIPASAEVGQTIVVKSVDENGKPTEWEAVDLPSGGGQAIDKIAIKITETVHSISLLDDITLYNRIRANIKVVGDSANAESGVLGAITPSGILINYLLNATKTANGYLFFDMRLSEQGAESNITTNFASFAYNATALSHIYGMNRTRWTGALSLVPKATDWNFGAGTEIYLEAYRA